MTGQPVELSAVERERVVAPLERAWTLPPRMYTADEVFEVERRRIFHRDWVCVAHHSQIPAAGGHLAVDLVDQPVVITRDADGIVRALANVCRHRAMPVVEGCGTGRFLTCPYHLWSYRLDGSLHTAPMMEGADALDPASCALPELEIEVWEGFVFVSLAEAPPPLAPQLEPLRSLIADAHFADLVIGATLDYPSPWNWKILVENFMEAYHHIGPHRETLQPEYPARRSSVVDNEGGPWALLRMPGDHDELFAAVVFPTLLLAASASARVWYQLDVRGHDRLHLRIHYLVEPELLADPGFESEILPLVTDTLGAIHGEDIVVNEGPWRGLHAPRAEQGRLSPFERAIWQLNQLWLERVAD